MQTCADRGTHTYKDTHADNRSKKSLASILDVHAVSHRHKHGTLKEVAYRTAHLWRLCFLLTTGSPLQFYVDAINSGHVTAYGPGLSHGMVNKAATFTIVTKDAGEGNAHTHTHTHTHTHRQHTHTHTC